MAWRAGYYTHVTDRRKIIRDRWFLFDTVLGIINGQKISPDTKVRIKSVFTGFKWKCVTWYFSKNNYLFKYWNNHINYTVFKNRPVNTNWYLFKKKKKTTNIWPSKNVRKLNFIVHFLILFNFCRINLHFYVSEILCIRFHQNWFAS